MKLALRYFLNMQHSYYQHAITTVTDIYNSFSFKNNSRSVSMMHMSSDWYKMNSLPVLPVKKGLSSFTSFVVKKGLEMREISVNEKIRKLYAFLCFNSPNPRVTSAFLFVQLLAQQLIDDNLNIVYELRFFPICRSVITPKAFFSAYSFYCFAWERHFIWASLQVISYKY